jgi:hypothetical protein
MMDVNHKGLSVWEIHVDLGSHSCNGRRIKQNLVSK